MRIPKAPQARASTSRRPRLRIDGSLTIDIMVRRKADRKNSHRLQEERPMRGRQTDAVGIGRVCTDGAWAAPSRARRLLQAFERYRHKRYYYQVSCLG